MVCLILIRHLFSKSFEISRNLNSKVRIFEFSFQFCVFFSFLQSKQPVYESILEKKHSNGFLSLFLWQKRFFALYPDRLVCRESKEETEDDMGNHAKLLRPSLMKSQTNGRVKINAKVCVCECEVACLGFWYSVEHLLFILLEPGTFSS